MYLSRVRVKVVLVMLMALSLSASEGSLAQGSNSQRRQKTPSAAVGKTEKDASPKNPEKRAILFREGKFTFTGSHVVELTLDGLKEPTVLPARPLSLLAWHFDKKEMNHVIELYELPPGVTLQTVSPRRRPYTVTCTFSMVQAAPGNPDLPKHHCGERKPLEDLSRLRGYEPKPEETWIQSSGKAVFDYGNHPYIKKVTMRKQTPDQIVEPAPEVEAAEGWVSRFPRSAGRTYLVFLRRKESEPYSVEIVCRIIPFETEPDNPKLLRVKCQKWP